MTSIRLVLVLALTSSLIALAGCRSVPTSAGVEVAPKVVVREAPVVQFRGANSTTPNQPGDMDNGCSICSSAVPVHRFIPSGDVLRLERTFILGKIFSFG